MMCFSQSPESPAAARIAESAAAYPLRDEALGCAGRARCATLSGLLRGYSGQLESCQAGPRHHILVPLSRRASEWPSQPSVGPWSSSSMSLRMFTLPGQQPLQEWLDLQCAVWYHWTGIDQHFALHAHQGSRRPRILATLECYRRSSSQCRFE